MTVIIPNYLKEEFVDLLHKSNQGVLSTKQLAQYSAYWPELMTNIENTVRYHEMMFLTFLARKLQSIYRNRQSAIK